jgi:hypothetical protein
VLDVVFEIDDLDRVGTGGVAVGIPGDTDADDRWDRWIGETAEHQRCKGTAGGLRVRVGPRRRDLNIHRVRAEFDLKEKRVVRDDQDVAYRPGPEAGGEHLDGGRFSGGRCGDAGPCEAARAVGRRRQAEIGRRDVRAGDGIPGWVDDRALDGASRRRLGKRRLRRGAESERRHTGQERCQPHPNPGVGEMSRQPVLSPRSRS